MPWLDTVFPVRMTRIALVAPAGSMRQMLVAVAGVWAFVYAHEHDPTPDADPMAMSLLSHGAYERLHAGGIAGMAAGVFLIIVGIVMVVIAWVGSRLDGRFAIEWGKGGTQVEFRAQIKPPPPVAHPVRLSPIPSAQAQQLRTPGPTRSELANSDVIEGEGHTVEIDVAELKTLIRAAEAREAAKDGTADHGAAAPDAPQQRRSA